MVSSIIFDRLKKLGLIQREGAAKGGHWKIVNGNE